MASPAKALTEEQRQQIIAKLLAERRSKGGGQPPAVEEDEERSKRVQRLLAARAAARQHIYGSQQGHHNHALGAGILGQEQSLDALLSPGSTCSFQERRPAVHDPAAGCASPLQPGTSYNTVQSASEQHSIAQERQQQQQQQPSRLQAAAPRQLSVEADKGPVEVGRLWESTGWPLEQLPSYTDGEDYNDSCCSTPKSAVGANDQHLRKQLWQQFSPKQQKGQPVQAQQPWQQQPRKQLRQDRQQMQQPHEQQRQPQQRPVVQQPSRQPMLQQQRSQHQDRQRQRQQSAQQRQGNAAPRQQVRQQQQQQEQHRLPSPARQHTLPPGYPASAEERLLQLAQPKSANRQKYERMKQEAEQDLLQHCSFAPRTGRAPQHRLGYEGLPAAERLYLTAAERQARLERKAAEQQASTTEGCTFKPQTNKASHEKYLAAYEYVPIHKRLGEVLRSKNEKLAQIQLEVEKENRDATFTPRINPRSSVLALRRSRNMGPAGAEDSISPQGDQDRATGTGRGLRRTRSEADLLAQQQEFTFTPRINRSSKVILQASGEIPAGFLERQEYFDRLAREKKQLLQLAVEDQHCSFTPGCSTSDLALGHSLSSLEDEGYLDRIERLAYQDSRKKEAARAALAEQVYGSECTFRPAINPRSQRIAQPTPLQELYENTKGKMKRGAAALAVQMQHEQECTFSPNLQKPGVPQASPIDAKLSLSASEVDEVVRRLHSAQQSKEDKVEAAMSFKQYQELKQCTFAPEINKELPRQQGPVLVRGLGRFMELKEMAKRQAEQKAAVEAKVFMTNIQAHTRQRPFTVPKPFRLGRSAESEQQEEQRRQQLERTAQQQADRECTFRPQINSNHKTRQERVQKLLEMRASAG